MINPGKRLKQKLFFNARNYFKILIKLSLPFRYSPALVSLWGILSLPGGSIILSIKKLFIYEQLNYN